MLPKILAVRTLFVASFLLAASWFACGTAYAGTVFFTFDGEKVIEVAPLPDREEYRDREGNHFDIGLRYKQITIFFMPLWNYDKRWCGYIDGSDNYVVISSRDIVEIARYEGIHLPSQPIPMWDFLGGKFVSLLILAFSVFGTDRFRSPSLDAVSRGASTKSQ